MQPAISILIVNWRSVEYVRKCLSTIFADPSSWRFEVIVVDNASFDGIARVMPAEFGQAVFLQSTQNLGFGAANNLAFSRSTGARILYLNPDTEIPTGALWRLAEVLDANPQAGMVGPRLLNTDLSVQATCITSLPTILNQMLSFEWLRNAFPRWTVWGNAALLSDSKTPSAVEAIAGACMLCRRDVVEQVRGFDASYFMYLEDMDLCLRIRELGYQIFYVPDVEIVHHGGGSSALRRESNFSSVMQRVSMVQYFAKHRGSSYAAAYRLLLIPVSVCRIFALVLALPILWTKRGRAAYYPLRKWCHVLIWAVGVHPITRGSTQAVSFKDSAPRRLPSEAV
jgi:hypothetical protein